MDGPRNFEGAKEGVVSRAFTKEPDEDRLTDEELNLPSIEGPVLLTPAGLVRLEARLSEAHVNVGRLRDASSPDEKLAYARALRELRILEQQRAAAVVIDPSQHPDTIAFGARVTVEDEDGKAHTYTLVGETEADPTRGLINVKSPLAGALLGQRVGDTVTWQRPAWDATLAITGIEYPEV